MPFYEMGEYERHVLVKNNILKGPKIVVVGGGTGLSVMLGGLKKYSLNITAVVTVADDGGGSGILRKELGILPPGDIRNCMLALAETEPIIKKLLNYRFTQGELKGQNFGNLFLAAMAGISESFTDAVRKMSEVLAVTGEVLPVTDQYIELCATLEDGTKICGESNIGNHSIINNSRINDMYLIPSIVKPVPDVINKIKDAEIIVLGPGSLYTSIIPNLLVDGVADNITNSKAVKIYICNVMTQPGETECYSAYDHLKTLIKFGVRPDYMIINNKKAPDNLINRYKEEGAEQVIIDKEKLSRLNVNIKLADILLTGNDLIRHDADKLSKAIMDLFNEDKVGEI